MMHNFILFDNLCPPNHDTNAINAATIMTKDSTVNSWSHLDATPTLQILRKWNDFQNKACSKFDLITRPAALYYMAAI